MLGILNFISMIYFGILGSKKYIESTQPAKLEQQLEEENPGKPDNTVTAYDYCSRLRNKSRSILGISLFNYFIYTVVPLNLPIASTIFDSYLTALLVSLIFFVPGVLVFYLGRKALGAESMAPRKYRDIVSSGIYSLIRHPQHLGELCFWFFIAFLLNSPMLVIFSAVFWIPNYMIWCVKEEEDLLLRYPEEYREYKKETKFIVPFIL